MQIAPFSWRAWWNAAPAACSAWVAMKFPLPEHAERVADAERRQRAADDLGGGQRLHRAAP